MKIEKNTSHKHIIFYGILLLVILIVLGITTYVLFFNKEKSIDTKTIESQQINSNPATDEQIKAGQDAKQKSVEESEKQTPSESTNNQQLTVTITSANQNGSNISIRGLISDIVSQTGSCSLTITNGTKSLTKTASTQALANSSTCKGFDIPLSELGAGTWKVTLSITIDNKTGSASTTINTN